MNVNPFNITKAVDYTDEQIYNFWVDLPHNSFSEILKPTSPMPMLILGAKGSGKTHIMRYFSFSLQSLRYQDIPILEGIRKDGYVGVYMRCNGLNSDRFSFVGQNIDVCKAVFSFYIEIWLAQLLINTIIRIDIFSKKEYEELEKEVVQIIINQFDKVDDKSAITNFVHLNEHLRSLQKKIDYEINNYALNGKQKLNIEITVSPGKLIFGIPQILTENIREFELIKFLYLIDEYENLKEYQQQYINTLIREKEHPVTFKIGARLYGIQTLKTFSADEELKEGSEYERFNIDKIFRDREKDYREFISNICINRLIKHGYQVFHQDINPFFEKAKISELRIEPGEKKYFKDLERKLSGFPKDTISQIISNLAFEGDKVLERTNVFLLYRYWKKGNIDLSKASQKIKEDCITYYHTRSKDSDHDVVLDKYKNDIIDQLYRETISNIPYTGFDTFIKMSAGIPRHMLIILKHIFRWSSFNNEAPFKTKNKISIDSQINGLKDASEWFLADARIICDDPGKVRRCFDRLGRFLQEIRFSDLPPECSISSFSFNLSCLSPDAQKIVDYLEQYSYIIRVNQRRDKNTNRKDICFQINGIIAPVWDLAIQRRGVVQLSDNEVKYIFEIEDEKEFIKMLATRLLEYNAPFHIESYKLPFGEILH